MTCCRTVLIAISAWIGTGFLSPAVAQDPHMEVTAGQMALSPPQPVMVPEMRPLDMLVQVRETAPRVSLRPHPRESWSHPVLRWDGHPRGPRWTAAVMSALRGPGAPLLDAVPRDIQSWCPGYAEADRGQRAAFWAGLISALAWHESTHRPQAIGGGGRWFGLVQIAPGTARWRSCEVQTGNALLDGAANLRCGVRIMAITVPRDGVVSEGMRGVAADWGPFHSSRKREDMRDWVSGQSYCQSRTRPTWRPEGLMAGAIRPVAGAPRLLVGRPVVRPISVLEQTPQVPASLADRPRIVASAR